MKIELTRYLVKPGKSQTVREWLDFLNQNMDAVTETLVGEKMYVETIFSETVGETEYLYWYSAQGKVGQLLKNPTIGLTMLTFGFGRNASTNPNLLLTSFKKSS